MALSAIIFDVDGTLVDSNAAHVRAWVKTLKDHGYVVAEDRIAVEVGKGGDQLIPSVLGAQIDRADGDSLRKGHTQEYIRIAESAQLRPFHGVENLLTALRQRGLKLALATSSKQRELQTTQKSAGVDWSGYFDVITTGDDADQSKPAPDILHATLRKLKFSPAQCAMVGDTPYDAEAARDAGVLCLGVSCGGMNDAKKLRAAGMRKVYANPEDMLRNLDEALRAASPGSAMITQKLAESLMAAALSVARRGMDSGEVPIGCVIARGDGTIIAEAHNELNKSQNKTAHAEIVAFAQSAGRVSSDARDLILVSTLEPCVMCLGAAMEAAVDTILFGLSAPADGGRARVHPPVSPESQMPRIWGGILAEQSRQLLDEFLHADPVNPAQAQFVSQLLTLAR